MSLAVSAASLIVMVFGIRLGAKAMFKSETLYGDEAIDRFWKIERLRYNGHTMRR